MVHTPHFQTPYITPYIVHAQQHGLEDANDCESFFPPSTPGHHSFPLLVATMLRAISTHCKVVSQSDDRFGLAPR